jgi:hypothetical protein
MQWSKEEGQTIQWSKEEGQTIQWSKEKEQHVKNWNLLFYCSNIAKAENAMLWRMLSRLETCIVYCCIWSVTLAKSIVPRKTWPKLWHFNCWHVHTLRSVFVNSPPPKPKVILTNFFAEPTVLLVPITSRDISISLCDFIIDFKLWTGLLNFFDFTIRNMYSLFLYMKCNSHKINRPTKNMTKIVTLLHF